MTTPNTESAKAPRNREWNIKLGVAINRVRKLQRQWDYWFPRRQQSPIMGQNAEQMIAERECSRLAPLLFEAKQQRDEAERHLYDLSTFSPAVDAGSALRVSETNNP